MVVLGCAAWSDDISMARHAYDDFRNWPTASTWAVAVGVRVEEILRNLEKRMSARYMRVGSLLPGREERSASSCDRARPLLGSCWVLDGGGTIIARLRLHGEKRISKEPPAAQGHDEACRAGGGQCRAADLVNTDLKLGNPSKR